MARYIPQHVFDALVVERLMSKLAGNDDLFNDLLDRYRNSYPDEDASALLADVSAAAAYGRDLLAEMPAPSSRDEMARLERILEILKQDLTRDKPLWRRMVENFFLNVQSKPIPDRAHQARAALARCAGYVAGTWLPAVGAVGLAGAPACAFSLRANHETVRMPELRAGTLLREHLV